MCDCPNPNLRDHVNGGVDVGEKDLLAKIHAEDKLAHRKDSSET